MKRATTVSAWPRLLAAYEELVEAEAFQVRAGDATELVRTQERLTPVIERIVDMAGTADAAVGAQLAMLANRRRDTANALERQLQRTREGLGEMGQRQRQLTRIAPVYREAAPRPQRFAETV